ncbi:acetoin utilization protein AcuB [Deferribacter desulfuricans SSM1]|uniref:Acetoin utilization protein AcuB n=1 Tax=Deferribacter desulfuricans (strain DSM 14783 / JCM 11476 / NBRC 101012 / SSM1) TaxID=639282 RepID=D3PBL5_DEFDS|nr:CBS and ACT domain-containing protein [Deferribacter desulfuricans]BAI79988.1 acetoin utilization protein AcuB [Deferribacter desulfuricans SSM1]
MFVKDWMTKNVITVFPDTKIDTAAYIMLSKNIKHLPVVNSEKELLGIVVKSDIREVMPESTIDKKEDLSDKKPVFVKDIMSNEVVSINENDTLEDALLFIYQGRIGALPVVDDVNRVVGIISRYDILKAMVAIMGLEEPGSRVDVVLEDRPGMLELLAKEFKELDINIISVIVSNTGDKKRIVSIRFDGLFKHKVEEHLKSKGFKIYYPWKS